MTCDHLLRLLRFLIAVGAPVLATFGVGVSAYGTYLVIEWYTPVSGGGFIAACRTFLWKAIIFDFEAIKGKVGSWAEISKKLGDENRENTIKGILIIFAGFLLQALGGVLWALDVVLPQVKR